MHELGIVTYIIKAVDKIAEENQIFKIESVVLEIGEVSGIVPDYLVDCWNYFKKRDPLLEESELQYETLPAVTFCENCRAEYATVEFGKICPHCGSEHTYLLTGNECNIKELTAIED